MTAVVHPSTFPNPQSIALTAAERRQLEGMAGNAPASARTKSRDYLATAVVSYTFTAAQYALWEEWWRTTLLFGGRWFLVTDWLLPQGGDAIVRYTGNPTTDHLGRGYRSVSIQATIRGRSLNPVTS